ncbi:hypothetical protein ACQ4PT_004353 [Festuca glaucescens]
MALEGPAERRDEGQQAGVANGNCVAPPPSRMAGRPSGTAAHSDRRLRFNPNTEHKSQDYTDVRGEYAPAVYSALERHLRLASLRPTVTSSCTSCVTYSLATGPMASATRFKGTKNTGRRYSTSISHFMKNYTQCILQLSSYQHSLKQ